MQKTMVFIQIPAYVFHKRNFEIHGGLIMREQQKDSVQSRFTEYLVVAVANRRKRYLEKKHRTMEQEVVHQELLELGYVNFELQYHTYVSDREALITENWTDLDTLTELLKTPQLISLVKELKEKERKDDF